MDESAAAALAALKAAREAVDGIDLMALSHRELLQVTDALEEDARRAPVMGHRILNRLAAEANPIDLGATTLSKLLAFRLRIGRGEAQRRIDAAAELGPRRAMSGELLEPVLEYTAAAQRRGEIGAEHIAIIREFFAKLPQSIDVMTRARADRKLARIAAQHGPEGLRKAANRLMAHLHPDGDLCDEERARRRSFSLGRQGADGMSKVSGDVTPEMRTVLEAVLAKLAAPGMCNPDDEQPTVDGEPDEASVRGDRRTQVQRNHDALLAMGRALLCSGTLGQLNGLPVSVIVSTTLQELESGTGQAVTGGGSLLPMRDVIRMASHSFHYLAVFDKHTSEALYLGGPGGAPTPRSGSCCTPGIAGVRGRGAMRRVTVARFTMRSPTGRTTARRTSTTYAGLRSGQSHGRDHGMGYQEAQRRTYRLDSAARARHGAGEGHDYHHPERMLLDPDDDDDGPQS